MRKGIFRGIGAGAAVAGAAIALLAPSTAQAFCEGEGARPSELSVEQARGVLLCLVNEQRARAGAKPLRADRRLERAAQRHSGSMDAADYFSHSSPNGASPLTRIRSTGYLRGAGSWGVGENLRWGSGNLGSPRVTVTSWMQSPSHRSTMLSPRYRHIGIGTVFGSPVGESGGDAAIYTADFGYRK